MKSRILAANHRFSKTNEKRKKKGKKMRGIVCVLLRLLPVNVRNAAVGATTARRLRAISRY